GDPAKTIELAGFKAVVGDNDLSGKLTANLSGKRPAISAVLKSKKLDLAALAGASGGKKDGGGGGGGTGTGQSGKKSKRVFSNEPLALDGLRAVDVRMKFDAQTIVVSGAVLEKVSLGLSLKAGNLLIKPVKSAIANGTLNGSIRLDGRKKAAGLVVKLALDKVDLNRLLSELKITKDVEGKGNISIDVSGRGSSVRAIMASLGGRAGLLMGKGRMKDSFLQSMLGGSGALLNRILDKGQKGYTAVECAVADFTIKKGVATAKALYIDLDSRGVIGSGTVNLGKEKLNLTIDPRNKKKIGKAVLPVRITGTFMNPKYAIDKKVVAGKLTKMLGVQLPSSLTGSKSATRTPLIEGPCAPPAPKARKKQATTTTQTKQAAPKPKDPIKDAEEKLKKGLKGLFGN
ncbi:MAG: AsmA family protein, partial [Alphaproteobacteria bacterium]